MNAQHQLPQPVRDLAERLCGSVQGGDVRLTQRGRMRQDAAAGWMKFTATQTISTTSCAFDWRARTGPFGVVSVRDALVGGVGVLDLRALGFIPVARPPSSPALTRGELMRYLAELALAPAAILHNASLRWRSEGPDRLIVTAGDGETAADVSVTIDGDGRIASIFAPDRMRGVGGESTATPWSGRYSDYRQHGGCWLPFHAEVSWTVDGREFVYWEGDMESWAAGG